MSGLQGRTRAVVDALVDARLVTRDARAAAEDVVSRALAEPAPAGPVPGTPLGTVPLRHRFAELAGYVGGAFVVSAAALFFSAEWPDLSTGERVGILAGIAVLLAAVGGALAVTGGGLTALRTSTQAVRRRLVGVLLTGGALAGAGAVGVQTAASLGEQGSAPVLAAALTMALLTLLGYLVAPTVLGQVALAGALVVSVPAALDVAGVLGEISFGLLVLALGLCWLALAEPGAWPVRVGPGRRRAGHGPVWHEPASARVVGCVLAVVGAQIPVGSPHAWVGYLATVLVAGAGFAVYVVRRAWPYLAAGVAGLTLAVPEALLDWTEGALGPAGVLLAAGVTLLGAALLGLRLRREVHPGG